MTNVLIYVLLCTQGVKPVWRCLEVDAIIFISLKKEVIPVAKKAKKVAKKKVVKKAAKKKKR